MPFQKAVRAQGRARVAIDGPAKAGKSKTALRLAWALGGRTAAIDTEFGSLSKYAGDQDDDDGPYVFDVEKLSKFSPADYVAAIREAEQARYDNLIIDSLSHAWVGEGGILDQLDRSKSKNQFTKWADLTPQQRRLVDAILASPLHLIVTMRSKMEYVLEFDPIKNKQVPRKVGMGIVQRDGMEYEFDLLCSIDQEHLLTVSGSRCPALDGASAPKPGSKFFKPYVDWLRSGVEIASAAGAPSPPSTNGHAPSDSPAIAEIKRLRSLLDIDAESWTSILQRRGVTTARDLTPGQQQDLIGALQLKIQQSGQTLHEALEEQQKEMAGTAGEDKSVERVGY